MLLPCGIPLSRSQIRKLPFQFKQTSVILQPLFGKRPVSCLCGKGCIGIVEVSPCMSMASNDCNIRRQSVISRISVCMQISVKTMQEFQRILRFSVRPVLIQDSLRAAGFPGPVHPHIGFALCFLSFLMQNLYRCFICMKDLFPDQPFFQLPVIYKNVYPCLLKFRKS